MPLTALSLDAFTRKLASADPTPGGGSVAAAVGSLGAGLVRMVALLTSNSPKHADVADRCNQAAQSAQTLVDDLLKLVDEDAASFDRVSAAYRLPKSSDAEKSARSSAIQVALEGAIEPPLRVIGSSKQICDLAAVLADIGNPNALSDIGCAALCAQAAAHGAALNVEINAGALKDSKRASAYTERVHADLAQVSLLAEVILGKLRTKAGG
jgi:glutamate formiminotransferase / formiminotetrahydrofolate cyclodeaminase